MNLQNEKYIFWINNVSILFANDKYLDFVPTASMTRVEQLNALTRFSIYALILCILSSKKGIWLHLPIITIIFTVVLYKIFVYDKEGQRKELEKIQSINTNDDTNNIYDDNNNDDDNDNDDNDDDNDNINVEAGYYDSDNNLYIGSNTNKRKKNDIKYTLDELIKYKKNTCRKPTSGNPFMNPSLSDTLVDNPPEACNADDEDIQEKMIDMYNVDLYRDVGDLFEIKNSQRQFFTIPTPSNPPDTVALAKWLYTGVPVCKTDQNACYNYENLKYKSMLK
jgi:hypothetical protein